MPRICSSGDLQIPRATVQRHLGLLETSFQLLRLPPYAVNRTKRLVIELGQRLLAIEVKASVQPRFGDSAGLRLFRQEHSERFAGGLLLHGGTETQWLAEDILATPWWRVL